MSTTFIKILKFFHGWLSNSGVEVYQFQSQKSPHLIPRIAFQKKFSNSNEESVAFVWCRSIYYLFVLPLYEYSKIRSQDMEMCEWNVWCQFPFFHSRLLFRCQLLLELWKISTVNYYSVATFIRDLRVVAKRVG